MSLIEIGSNPGGGICREEVEGWVKREQPEDSRHNSSRFRPVPRRPAPCRPPPPGALGRGRTGLDPSANSTDTSEADVPTLLDQLLGSWELVSYQLELDTGRIVHPLGEDAIGLILYTPQRRMSVNIMRPGRANWASPNPAAGTESEIAEAAAGYLAYGGSFAVDESLSAVEHYVDISLFPNWIGAVQRRFVDLTGEELVLESPVITDAAGTSVTPRLRWRRIT